MGYNERLNDYNGSPQPTYDGRIINLGFALSFEI